MPIDKLIIQQLEIPVLIGLNLAERQAPQKLRFDFELFVDITQAALDDDIDQAVNYYDCCEQIKAWLFHTQFKLIETLAEKLAAFILQTFKVSGVCLRIRKEPADMPDIKSVSVEVKRGVSHSRFK